MPGTPREPTEEDGPLFRAAADRAAALDRADSATSRKRAWGRFIPSALAALAEAWLREMTMFAAVLACVIAVLTGVTSGHLGWAVGLTFSGIAGAVLVIVAALRRWAFRMQWATYAGVLLVHVALLIALWQLG